MYDIVTSAILFFLLAPGALITLPPGQAGILSAIVHAAVFYVVQAYLSTTVPWWAIWVGAIAVLAAKWSTMRSSTPSY
jgi:hypothetical protein